MGPSAPNMDGWMTGPAIHALAIPGTLPAFFEL